jgi:hypothetical protein
LFANTIIRSTVMVCVALLVSGCTIKPSSGVLACTDDGDCPARFVCRQVAANNVQRCVDPQTAAWQPNNVSDAATDAAAHADATPGDGTPDAGKDAGYAGGKPDAGTDAQQDAGPPDSQDSGPRDPLDSGLQVTGAVTVMQTVSSGSAKIRVTEAAIEVQPTLCGPASSPSNKQICVTGGIRP